MTLPDFRTFLPSRVHEAVKAHVLGRLKEAKLNIYADPMYSRVELWKELEVTNERTPWLTDAADKAFQEALDTFEKECPVGWSNSGQRTHRTINGQRKYASR